MILFARGEFRRGKGGILRGGIGLSVLDGYV
jgi:hypothetical protein